MSAVCMIYHGDNKFLYNDLMKEISNKVELVVVTKNNAISPVNYISYSK